MAENLIKVPVKGILKNSTSFEGTSTAASKCSSGNRGTKWDEMNILATHHPPDKDYGHMKIEEPKTPFSYQGEDSGDESEARNLDSGLLAEKLMVEGEKSEFPRAENVESEGEDEEEDGSPEDMAKRRSFEHKRKAHYNEFMAVKLARQLMEKEEEIEDEGELVVENKTEVEEVELEDIDPDESNVEAAVSSSDNDGNIQVLDSENSEMDTKDSGPEHDNPSLNST